jgi:hypothetical protein
VLFDVLLEFPANDHGITLAARGLIADWRRGFAAVSPQRTVPRPQNDERSGRPRGEQGRPGQLVRRGQGDPVPVCGDHFAAEPSISSAAFQ